MFGEPFPEKVDALCDYVTERDKHQRCAGNSENCANAAAGKPGRDMRKEAERAEHQHREDAGDNGAFTIFHRYASTVTSVLGFAWQARMMPFRLSSSSSASCTAMSTSPDVIFVLHTPQVPIRQEKSMPIPSSSDNSRIV